MSTCKGCNSRLRKPVGSSGFCDPCYLVVRVERLVFTRCPPHAANDLVDYLKKVTTTLETACEKLESDRTAGFVNEFGEPIPGALDKVSGAAAGGTTFDQGIHPGSKDQHTESGKEPLVDAKERGSLKRDRSRRRRRSGSKSRRSRSRHRSRRKDKDAAPGSPVPVATATEEDEEDEPRPSSKVEEEEEEVLSEGEAQSTEEVRDDVGCDKKFELKRTAKPSARKPLPRRPRSPYSPLDHRRQEERKPKKWKGFKHVIRGQTYYNSGASRGKGKGKGKGKRWHQR